jgi:transposase
MNKIYSISEFMDYRDEAHLKYEIIRPVLLKQNTKENRAQELNLHEKTLEKYLRLFHNKGYLALLDQRHGPSKRKGELSDAQKAHIILLHLAYSGFSSWELATVVGKEHNRTIDYKTVLSILKQYEELFAYSQSEEVIEHLLVRFRQYHEYTPIVAGRYHIIELIESGWKVSTICEIRGNSREAATGRHSEFSITLNFRFCILRWHFPINLTNFCHQSGKIGQKISASIYFGKFL